jgi:hypothetical protein
MTWIGHNQAGRAQGSLSDSRYFDAGSERIVPRQSSEFRPAAERTLTFATPPSWTVTAKCIEDAEFSKTKAEGYDRDYMKPEKAEAMCAGCSVIEACLAAALEAEGDVVAHYRYGIWGGTTPKMRAEIVAAAKTCSRGHEGEMVEDVRASGKTTRRCRACDREDRRRNYWAKREVQTLCPKSLHADEDITTDTLGRVTCLGCKRDQAEHFNESRSA